MNYLKVGALEFYLREINSQMPSQIAVDKLHAGYNTLYRKLSFESEADSLNFDEFMSRHQIQDGKNVYTVWLNTSTTSQYNSWAVSILNQIR